MSIEKEITRLIIEKLDKSMWEVIGSSDRTIKLVYSDKVSLWFLIVCNGNTIEIRNKHRFVSSNNREKGFATSALNSFEETIKGLSKNVKLPIVIIFESINVQADTKKFLVSQGYVEEFRAANDDENESSSEIFLKRVT